MLLEEFHSVVFIAVVGVLAAFVVWVVGRNQDYPPGLQ